MLFHEYFHGDNGRGVGASHQTGWTALVRPLHRGPGAAAARGAASQPEGSTPGRSRGAGDDEPIPIDDRTEWLEADGLGGFASGTTLGHPHPPLPRAAPGGHDAARPGAWCWSTAWTPGSRRSDGRRAAAAGVSDPAALRAGRRRAGARAPRSSRSPHEPWPTWTYRLRGRHADRARAVRAARAARSWRSDGGLDGAGAAGAARGAPVPLGPRLARAAPRECRVPLRGGGRAASG